VSSRRWTARNGTFIFVADILFLCNIAFRAALGVGDVP
jgi:hypothetical protein